MSITGDFLMMTAAQFECLESTFGDDDKFYEALAELFHPMPILPNRHPENCMVDVGDWWHMLHCAITGDSATPSRSQSPPPLGMIFSGGTKVELGSALFSHFLTPSEVMEISQALNALSVEEMRKRVATSAFMDLDLYHIHWCCYEGGADDLLDFYEDLVDFFRRAATQQNYVLFQLS
ncbi:DUF1877 family protein [Acaryochloris sp. CCMEE 5410]|uniref:DUF1877 family protein n=1 Tax=Acaryochloris sp. CCMEE 5410 TaxID=310037 RepID=UPI0002484C2D|nr:DUF1877 family protein [Acaryochloris sp. CCMEE 5410]KAI9133826.1 DUF1877 family protein [Acaryochloris sp. CCMEE 5410]